MGRPGNVYEYDAYPMPNVPRDRKPLSKEEEDKLIEELHERIRKHKAAQELERSRKIG